MYKQQSTAKNAFLGTRLLCVNLDIYPFTFFISFTFFFHFLLLVCVCFVNTMDLSVFQFPQLKKR